jgi:hypothetical protein
MSHQIKVKRLRSEVVKPHLWWGRTSPDIRHHASYTVRIQQPYRINAKL